VSELSDLYQEVILDHNRRPRHYGAVSDANRRARGHNPLCGDQLTLTLRLEDERIEAIAFEGSGCAISRASASLMTDAVAGRTLPEVVALFDRFHAAITAPMDTPVDEVALGKLAALAGVRSFPVRIKCASLPWHTLRAALANSDIVSTE
jgi:nitrogen fixation NifU-like protein